LRLYRVAAIALFILMASTAVYAVGLAAPGYACVDTPVNLQGMFLGGFDVLPNGNFVINDGYSVREITPAGADVSTLYTFSSSVFASFVRVSGGNVYFAESSTGGVYVYDYAGSGGAALLGTVNLNYDVDLWNGKPCIVAGKSDYSASCVYLLENGTADLIVDSVPSWSGPLAFDSEGSLLYAPGDPASRIYRWTSAEVSGAVGSGALTTASADVLASVKGPYGFAFGPAGQLLFSTNGTRPTSIMSYANGSVGTFATCPSGYLTNLRYNPYSGGISAVVGIGANTFISTLLPVPEPSSVIGLSALAAMASLKLRRPRARS
jgi:hypothetical protein